MSFFWGRWPRWRVTLEVAAFAPGGALGGGAAPLWTMLADMLRLDNCRILSCSWSEGEGVVGKYSNFGESKVRADMRSDMDGVRGWIGTHQALFSYILQRALTLSVTVILCLRLQNVLFSTPILSNRKPVTSHAHNLSAEFPACSACGTLTCIQTSRTTEWCLVQRASIFSTFLHTYR